jgi:branched-subunit amino acid permease
MVELVAIYLIMGLATVYLMDRMLGAVSPEALALMTNGQRILTSILWPLFLSFVIVNFIWGYISGLNNRK